MSKAGRQREIISTEFEEFATFTKIGICKILSMCLGTAGLVAMIKSP